MRKTYTSRSIQDTFAIAKQLLETLPPGTVLTLTGDLGAGKTAFVQGLAAAMGIQRPVTSPTFALIQEYPAQAGRMLVHLDLYRLAGAAALEEIGFTDYIAQGALIAVEWPERAAGSIPANALHITIDATEDDVRTITIQGTPS